MPLFWLSLAFLSGILLAANYSLRAAVWLVLGGVAFLFWAVLRWRASRGTVQPGDHPAAPGGASFYLLLLLSLFLGAARYQSVQPEITPDFIAWYNDQEPEFIVEGILVQPPDERDGYTNLRLETKEIRSVDNLLFTPVQGLLLARVQPGGDWHYGDRVHLQGYLQTLPVNEEFSYRDYLARQGIYAYMVQARASLLLRGQGSPILAALYGFKERALAMVYRLYPDPEASLLAGILLGVESGIPGPVQDAFKDTGTSHIIAISGFNIAIISGLFTFLFLRLLGSRRRFLAAGLSAAVVALYTLLVGADAAVVRAAIMGGLSLFARQVGRRQDGMNSLAFVAAAMAVFNPYLPWDVGFQLSFMATLGLVLYAEPFSQAFLNFAARRLPLEKAKRLAGPVGEYFLFTLAAQIMTLPITIYHFQRFSLTSFLANPVILPAQPPVMILGGLAVLLGLVFVPLGQLAAYLAWPFVGFTIRAVEWIAAIPGGVINLGDVSLVWILLFYAILLFWTFGGERFKGLGAYTKPSAVIAGLGLVGVVVWQTALLAPDGRLHLVVMDVGSGDALLIQAPGGERLLVNGGPSPSALSDALGRRLPITQRSLDYLIVASPGDNQLAALPRVIERFPVKNVLWAGPTHASRSARDLQDTFNSLGIRPVLAETEDPGCQPARCGSAPGMGQLSGCAAHWRGF
jgi:competence protein ComEC